METLLKYVVDKETVAGKWTSHTRVKWESNYIWWLTVLWDPQLTKIHCGNFFVVLWPIPDDHFICKERNRSARHDNIEEMLLLIENSYLCEGFPDIDEVCGCRSHFPRRFTTWNNSVHFELSVSFRSAYCSIIKETYRSQQLLWEQAGESQKH